MFYGIICKLWGKSRIVTWHFHYKSTLWSRELLLRRSIKTYQTNLNFQVDVQTFLNRNKKITNSFVITMNFLTNITSSATLQTPKNILSKSWLKSKLEQPSKSWAFPVNSIRNASKKQGGSTRNTHPKVRPKHRGWKVQDGHDVTIGTILATQLRLRFHPGLNVNITTLVALPKNYKWITWLGWPRT